jgi:copper chaperone
MISFEVQDMTCGHCASTITKAVQATDQAAQVHIDLSAHRVDIESREADVQALREAISDAGYTPVPLAV